MKRILYLTLTIMLCLTFFTAVTWAEEKASAASDKILSQQQVDELLQADDNPAAYVKIDEDAYKVYPDFKDKKAVRKELLKNLPTNKVLYLLTASEQTFTLAFDDDKVVSLAAVQQAEDDVTEEVITDDVQTETVDVSDEIIETSQATEE